MCATCFEGSVQRQGDQIRITAQLIDAGTAAHIWSDRWDRPVADLFAVQAEISEQVANRLLDTGGAITTRRARCRPKGAALET